MTGEAPLRVFLASPGDLISERALVKSVIDRYNTRRRRDDERLYELVAWEDTRGTARRPQDEINALIGSCEFMIVLLKASWGSAPGSPFGYTSGTEEEFFTGLLELGIREQPLEDIWVGFVDAPAPAIEITDLKNQLRQRHSLLYESIESELDLDRKLSDRLDGWQKTAGTKTARWLNLLPSSGRDVLGAARKRLEGESLIRLGQTNLGFERLEEAALVGGPTEQLAYARALGRRGRLDEALTVARAAIDEILNSPIELNSTLAGEAFLTEAGVLRRQHSDLEAINRLGTILGELDGRTSDAWRVKARILDERGLANQRLERLSDARSDFGASFELRQTGGRSIEIVQSLVNLLRLESREKNFSDADAHAESMLEILSGTTPSDLHANAWTAIAQLRLREGRAVEGLPYALQALRLNEQTANTSGIAKTLLVLTQCSREAGEIEPARAYAERCIEVNESMSNDHGAQLARWQLEQLDDR